MNIHSKLPHVGTTIFTVMSQLAQQHGAVNLSQGFPDFDCSPDLIQLVSESMKKGLNQYSPMMGVKELREEIAKKTEELYGSVYHPEKEVTVSSGGSEAIFSAIGSVVHPGDEVIFFEPAYDLYRPVIALFGVVPKSIHLITHDFHDNCKEERKLFSEKS